MQSVNKTETTRCQCQCGGKIQIRNNLFACESCHAIVYPKLLGRDISEAEALALLSGEKLLMHFKSASGKAFSGFAEINGGKVSVDIQK
jgi:hypothetical protein